MIVDTDNLLVSTNLTMTGADVAFTFNNNMYSFWIQCSSATSSMYLASQSSGHAAFVLPVAGGTPVKPFFIPDLAGQTVTFNGTNATNVQIIEYLSHVPVGLAGPVGGFDPSSLPGALALWLFDEGSGILAKNHFAASPNPGTNLVSAPEQSFGLIGLSQTYWLVNGATNTDIFAANPDGNLAASRIQFASGDSNTNLAVSGGAATYTLSAYFKSNDGADHNLRLGIIDGGGTHNSGNLAVTNAGGWQRVSFTLASSGGVATIILRNDGTNAADVLVWGVQLEVGASPSAYRRQTLDFVFRSDKLPTWVSTGLDDISGNARGCALQNIPSTFTQLTAYLCAKQTADGTFQFAMMENGANFEGPAGGTVNGQGGVAGGSQIKIPTSLVDGSWHVLVLSWDGSTVSYTLDKTLMRTLAGGSSFTAQGFVWGVNIDGFGFKGNHGLMALYSSNHSASQIGKMTDYCRSVMAGRSVTVGDLSRFLIIEGDSIAAQTPGYAQAAIENCAVVTQWVDLAVGGSTASDVSSRLTADNAYLTPPKTLPVFSLSIGANDMGSGGQSAATFVANLKTLCLAIKGYGYKLTIATVLPRTLAGFNATRNSANALIRADTSFYDDLMSFDEDTIMGPDAAASNLTYYADGLHPTPTGAAILSPIAQVSYESLLGVRKIYDHFEDANSIDLTSHTQDFGPGWTAQVGQFTIQTHRAQATAAGAEYIANAGAADLYLTCKINITGANEAGLIFREQDSSNMWRVSGNANDGKVYLYSVSAGTPTTVQSVAASITAGTDFTLQVVLSGTSITVKVNNSVVITQTSSLFQTATKFGMRNFTGTANQWEDFLVAQTT